MKNKIAKILSVLLPVTIVASMIVGAMPVSAGIHTWGKIETPANNGQINPRVNWVGPIERAINGDYYCAVGLGDDPTTPLYYKIKTAAQNNYTAAQIKAGLPAGNVDADLNEPLYEVDNDKWNPNKGKSQKGWERNEVVIYRSTDGGRTWKECGAQPFDKKDDWDLNTVIHPSNNKGTSGVIFDIECSSVNANHLWVTDGYDIWRTVNNGTTWTRVANLFEEAAKTSSNIENKPHGWIVSISVGYVGSVTHLYAATSTFKIPYGGGGATENGGLYLLKGTTNDWSDHDIGANRKNKIDKFDVLDVQVLPGYGAHEGVVAVLSDYSFNSNPNNSDNGRTIVTVRFVSDEWGAQLGDVELKYRRNTSTNAHNVNITLISASIWVPTDFDVDNYPTVFVGIAPLRPDDTVKVAGQDVNTVRQCDVYECYFPINTGSGAGVAAALDLNVSGSVNIGTAVTDMDGIGGSILVTGYQEGDWGTPKTWATQDSGNTWTPDQKRPTGGMSIHWGQALSSVRVSRDFEKTGEAILGTHGSAKDANGVDINGDAGLSISRLPVDVCAQGFAWNTIYFISTHITQKVDMSVASDGTIYLTTYGQIKSMVWVDVEDPLDPDEIITIEEPWTVQLYSAWRYDGKYWERVNSYSLYPVDIEYDYVIDTSVTPPALDDIWIESVKLTQFDFVRVTPDNGFVILVDRLQRSIYFSNDRGNVWTTMNNQLVPVVNIYSVLLVGARNIMVGTDGGAVYYSRNLGNWRPVGGFGNADVGAVTDLRMASNQDIVAAAIGNNGNIFIARSLYNPSTNPNYESWTNPRNTGVKAGKWAFAAPADDYSSSGIIFVASSASKGIFFGTNGTAAADWIQTDTESKWFNTVNAEGYYEDIAANYERYLNNLVTAPGGNGFSEEGIGMAYLTANGSITNQAGTATTVKGVARVKGRVTDKELSHAVERILNPTSGNSTVTMQGLWKGAATIGAVDLYAFGSDCNIYVYTDTLNRPVTDVKVPSVSVEVLACPGDCPLFQATAQWNALANATYYLVIVTDDEQVVNYYDAVQRIIDGNYHAANILTTTAALIPNLDPQTKYFVSVWGLRYTETGNVSGDVAARAATIQGKSLSSFGGGTSFTTPPMDPKVFAPSAGASNVSVKPAFQWQAQPNATSYTLVVADNPNFTSPIKTVTTTATAYGWTASDPVLNYSTTYYWRVVANTPSGSSTGSTNVFTTENAPPPPPATPTLTVNVPPPTLTVPQPTVIITAPVVTPIVTIPAPTYSQPPITVVIPETPPTPTPFWVWVIVAVGAVLTIAVIILIIRTRRVV